MHLRRRRSRRFSFWQQASGPAHNWTRVFHSWRGFANGLFLIRSGRGSWGPAACWAVAACVSLSAASWVALQPGRLGDLHIVREWLNFWTIERSNPYPHFEGDLDYPPLAFLVLWPLHLLPDATLGFWFLPPAIAITALAGWTLLKWISERMYVQLTTAERVALVALMLSGGGIRRSLWLGQTIALSVLFGALALRWKKRRPLAAAAALAICSFKPHVAVGVALGILLIEGPTVLVMAGAIVAAASFVFAASAGASSWDIAAGYGANLIALYDGEQRISGLLSLGVVLDNLVAEHASRTIIHALAAVTTLGWIVVLSRRRATDGVTQVQVVVSCLLWSILFLPHQLYNAMLAAPALWLLMWPESGLIRRQSWRVVLVGMYVLFGVLDIPFVLRTIAESLPQLGWLWGVSYYTSPLRMALVFLLIVLTLHRRPMPRDPAESEPVARSVFRDPFVRAALATWGVIAAFYVIPGVSPAVLERTGDHYTTLALWPWAIAACLNQLAGLEHVWERRTWRLLAASFACLLATEVAWGVALNSEGVALNIATDWIYVAFYALQGLAAVELVGAAGSRARWRIGVLAACLAAGATHSALATLHGEAYTGGFSTSVMCLILDAATALLFVRSSRLAGTPRWRVACLGLAASMALFFVTDVVNAFHYSDVWSLDSGTPWDLLWTLPVVAFVVTIRAARLKQGSAGSAGSEG